MLAEHGAKVVVNDLGGSMDGEGNSEGPAHDVVEEIKGMGGEAVANGDDISDFEGAGRLVQQAVDSRRASTATSGRRTTAPPRPASPPSRSSRRRSSAATA
jgi:NAD(P)-dependent dehydrogenase (short-subunit alcohol dehydrogenase family)